MSLGKQNQEQHRKVLALIRENAKLVEAILKMFIDGVSSPVLILTDYRIVYANPQAVKLFGYSTRALRDLSIDNLFKTNKQLPFSNFVTKSNGFRTKPSERIAVRIENRSGSGKWFVPTFKRHLWKGKSSIVMSLNDLDPSNTNPENILKNELRLQLALKGSNQAVWDYNLKTSDLYLGKEYFAMLGYKPEEIKSNYDSWHKLVHSSFASKLSSMFARIVEGKETSVNWEYLARTKHDGYKWIMGIGRVVEWDYTGAPLRMVGIHMDIDDRKRLEIDRLDMWKTLQGFIRSSTDGLLLTNHKGDVIEWNAALERISQLKRNTVIGKPLWEVQGLLLASNEKAREAIERVKSTILSLAHSGKKPWEGMVFESQILLATGEIRTIQQSLFSISTETGVSIAATVKDITESKTALTKLEKSEERLKLAVSAGNVAVWDLDFVTKEKYFSPLTFQLLGYMPWEIEPSIEMLEKHIHPNDRNRIRESIEALFETGTSIDLVFKIQAKSGKYLWIESHNRIFRSDSGAPVRITGTFTDVTKQKEAEIELILHREELMKSLAQQELLSRISIIINTNMPFSSKNQEVLTNLGQFTHASRVYIFENSTNLKFTTNTYEWCNTGIDPQKDTLKNIPLPSIWEWSKNSEYLFSNNIKHDLPADIAQLMLRQNIQSFLIFPMWIEKKLFGYIGFDECNYPRTWERSEVELLRTIANLISFSFEREQILQQTTQVDVNT
ncbi:MAG: PAS domain-containing protein [Bacteroidales bacterium]|nr:PAS domain-containing protein [Bacteroidales bacterium]MBN2748272.1 PAS domain-containing protein [Bacteroidales bacterium]